MSGIYSGLQKRILNMEHNAVYIHCTVHNLNLVLNDACQHITAINEFYDVVQRLCFRFMRVIFFKFPYDKLFWFCTGFPLDVRCKIWVLE